MSSFIKIILRLLALLPLPVIHAIAYIIGWLSFLIPSRRRSTAITNIKMCLPELGTWQRWQLIRRNLIETTKGALESSAMWMHSGKNALKLVRGTVNEDLLQHAYARGKGVILAAPHLGMWEIIGLYCSSNYPMTCLYLPPPIAGLENIMVRGRGRLGAKLVPTDSKGVRVLLRALSNGELTSILPDHDPMGGQGAFAPFFGIQTYTMTLLSKLARKTDATVLFTWAERLSWGRGYRIHFHSADPAIMDEDLAVSLAALNAGVEMCIRQQPDQYLWCYKRFRTRPEGEPKLYHR